MIISVVSQKGGVGKSALARTIAAAYDKAHWSVLLADCDDAQSTSQSWADRRTQHRDTKLTTKTFRSVLDAISHESDYDLVVIDGAPHASRGTLQAAEQSTLTLIPTGSSIDDLKPTVALVNELQDAGVDPETIHAVLIRVTSDYQATEARDTLIGAGAQVIEGSISMQSEYINALDAGKSLTETRVQSLNDRARAVIKSINKIIRSKS